MLEAFSSQTKRLSEGSDLDGSCRLGTEVIHVLPLSPSELDVVTAGVANATGFFSLATNF